MVQVDETALLNTLRLIEKSAEEASLHIATREHLKGELSRNRLVLAGQQAPDRNQIAAMAQQQHAAAAAKIKSIFGLASRLQSILQTTENPNGEGPHPDNEGESPSLHLH